MKTLFALLIWTLPCFGFAFINGGGSEGGWPTVVVDRIGTVGSVAPCEWYTPIGSEHDPLWTCAQLYVTSGDDTGKTLEVVFSGSNDVVWYDSPKLQGFESGTFGLDTTSLPGHLVLSFFTPYN